MRKPEKIHSRARVRKNLIAKRKGRHMGVGESKGSRNSCMSSKKKKRLLSLISVSIFPKKIKFFL